MIQVATRMASKGMESRRTTMLMGCSPVGMALGAFGKNLRTMILAATKMIAVRKAMVRRLQPARRPSLPTKILSTAEGCGLEPGSAGSRGGLGVKDLLAETRVR